MITMQTVLHQLTGSKIAEALEKTMAEQFPDFVLAQKDFHNAMAALAEEVGADAVKAERDAIARQTASNLLFCGALGLKANLDNFLDPIARSFLDADFETYLREKTAHRLPEYQRAQEARNQFYALLSPELQRHHERISAYVSYLETAGPKLAHYCGYIMGNALLPRIIPGYHQDFTQTLRYRAMLEKHFGKRFLQTITDS